ncbi:MAG: GNAT family N-acetyltransferase [Elainellaceae cyanobacterium]
MPSNDPTALSYRCQAGDAVAPKQLRRALNESYQEQLPQEDSAHVVQFVSQFVNQYLGDDHRVWWAYARGQADPIGCLWLGYTVDPTHGDRHPYIFLVHVVPERRGQGIGTALITQAEAWARQNGYRKLSLNVFWNNAAGRQLYQRLDYQPQSILMEKTL